MNEKQPIDEFNPYLRVGLQLGRRAFAEYLASTELPEEAVELETKVYRHFLNDEIYKHLRGE